MFWQLYGPTLGPLIIAAVHAIYIQARYGERLKVHTEQISRLDQLREEDRKKLNATAEDVAGLTGQFAAAARSGR